MYSSLELDELNRFCSSVIAWCPVNMNITAPKIKALQVDPKI
jgi:hypothetical protein